DGRADLFSLGVVLYMLATGEQPFPGESMTAVSYKVVHTEPVPPRKLNPSVPGGLEAVILKCLTKSPDDRYQTGEDLAAELAALRTGTPRATATVAAPARAAGIDPNATLMDVQAASVARAAPAMPDTPVAAPAARQRRTGPAMSPAMLALVGGVLLAV